MNIYQEENEPSILFKQAMSFNNNNTQEKNTTTTTTTTDQLFKKINNNNNNMQQQSSQQQNLFNNLKDYLQNLNNKENIYPIGVLIITTIYLIICFLQKNLSIIVKIIMVILYIILLVFTIFLHKHQ